MNYTKYFEGINLDLIAEYIDKCSFYLKNSKNETVINSISDKNIWNSTASSVLINAFKENDNRIDKTINNLNVFSKIILQAKKVKTIQDSMKESNDYNALVSSSQEIEKIILNVISQIEKMETGDMVSINNFNDNLTSTSEATISEKDIIISDVSHNNSYINIQSDSNIKNEETNNLSNMDNNYISSSNTVSKPQSVSKSNSSTGSYRSLSNGTYISKSNVASTNKDSKSTLQKVTEQYLNSKEQNKPKPPSTTPGSKLDAVTKQYFDSKNGNQGIQINGNNVSLKNGNQGIQINGNNVSLKKTNYNGDISTSESNYSRPQYSSYGGNSLYRSSSNSSR